MNGTEFGDKILNLSGSERESAILDAAIAGQVPAFIKDDPWSAVQVGPLTIYVAPDYFSIGTASDYLRVPMTPMTAQKIADLYKSILPSRALVNAIWQAAKTKLAPSPFPPDAKMETSKRFIEHNAKIGDPKPSTSNLVAGHKKDIVVGPGLDGSRVAIYGWHQLNGSPIQPYSTVHGSYYADYSHGVRLVHRNAVYQDTIIDLMSAFKDPLLSKYVSDQGSFVPTFPSGPGKFVKATAVPAPVSAEPGQPTPPQPGPQESRETSLAIPAVAIAVVFWLIMSSRTTP